MDVKGHTGDLNWKVECWLLQPLWAFIFESICYRGLKVPLERGEIFWCMPGLLNWGWFHSLPPSLPSSSPPPPAILQCLETSLIALSRGRVLLSSSRKRPGMPLNILEYTEQPNNKDCSGPKCWRCSDGQSPAPVKRRGCSFELASCTWFVTRKAAGEADSHALPSSPDRPASYRTATTFQPGTNLGLSPLQEIHKGGDKNV